MVCLTAFLQLQSDKVDVKGRQTAQGLAKQQAHFDGSKTMASLEIWCDVPCAGSHGLFTNF